MFTPDTGLLTEEANELCPSLSRGRARYSLRTSADLHHHHMTCVPSRSGFRKNVGVASSHIANRKSALFCSGAGELLSRSTGGRAAAIFRFYVRLCTFFNDFHSVFLDRTQDAELNKNSWPTHAHIMLTARSIPHVHSKATQAATHAVVMAVLAAIAMPASLVAA